MQVKVKPNLGSFNFCAINKNDKYIQKRAKSILAFEISKVIDFPMDIREEYDKNFEGESKVIEFKKLR